MIFLTHQYDINIEVKLNLTKEVNFYVKYSFTIFLNSFTSSIKGAWSRFWSNSIFMFLLFTMLKKCISNDEMKFESQSLVCLISFICNCFNNIATKKQGGSPPPPPPLDALCLPIAKVQLHFIPHDYYNTAICMNVNNVVFSSED